MESLNPDHIVDRGEIRSWSRRFPGGNNVQAFLVGWGRERRRHK
jgi:hypothetical protein